MNDQALFGSQILTNSHQRQLMYTDESQDRFRISRLETLSECEQCTAFYPEHLGITLKDSIMFKELQSNPKFHDESSVSNHLDREFGKEEVSLAETQNTLRFLFTEFSRFIDEMERSIPSLGNTEYPLYWLDYGSALGSYRENDIIRWDDDGDVGMFDFILDQMPYVFETDHWIFRRNPDFNPFIRDQQNQVVARFISKENGVFIDVFAYTVIEDAVTGTKYVYNSWEMGDFNKWQKLDHLMPINPKGIFRNQTFNVPRDSKSWLLKYYSSLEPPADKVRQYGSLKPRISSPYDNPQQSLNLKVLKLVAFIVMLIINGIVLRNIE